MEQKQTTIVIGLLTLIIGLLTGYIFGMNTVSPDVRADMMYEEMEEHRESEYEMHEEELIARDGAMQHAMEEMMFNVRGKTGAAYEEAFLRGMIVHHIGAIEMAEDLLEHTDRPELVAMANDIITTQSREVETMKGWLATWFNEEN